MKEKIIELAKEREKNYQEIKRKLLPIILKFIKAAEKVQGSIRYWELRDKIETFGLTRYDFRRIIDELDTDGLIRDNGFLTTRWAINPRRNFKKYPPSKDL